MRSHAIATLFTVFTVLAVPAIAANFARANDLRETVVALSNPRFEGVQRQPGLGEDSEVLLHEIETMRVNELLAVTARAPENSSTAATEAARTASARIKLLVTGLASQVELAAAATSNNLARIDESLAALQSGVIARLTALERNQKQGFDRPTVTGPQADLSELVRAMLVAQRVDDRRDERRFTTIAFIFAANGALIGVFGLLLALGGRKPREEPQIIFVPSAPGIPPVVVTP